MVLNEGKAEGRRSCGWGQGVIEDPNTTPGERAFIAIMAGVDQMGGCSNPQVLMDAYKWGCEKVGKETMDKAFATSAQRLLQGYFMTGMFENPYLMEKEALADVDSPDKQAEALKAQIKAVVMVKNANGAIRPREGRMKVYMPAIYEAPHKEMDHVRGVVVSDAKVSYPISLEMANEYFDVVTDRVDGANIERLSLEELKGIDMILIPAKEPGNSFPQDGRNEDHEFVPLTRQYRPYIADGPFVRKQSIAGDKLPDGTKENLSYFGRKALTTNEEQLDQILEMAEKAKALGVPSVVAMFTGRPMCFYEFEPVVDAILVTFSMPSNYGGGTASSEALAAIAAGKAEPSGLLPMQMPKDMDDVEKQAEDTPRDMECYTDSEGNKYDFAFGLDYQGVIRDERVSKYSAAPLTKPANMGV
jgi:beta-glucosidase